MIIKSYKLLGGKHIETATIKNVLADLQAQLYDIHAAEEKALAELNAVVN